MQSLTGTVGLSASNAIHDVALTQALLLFAHRPTSVDPTGRTYLSTITGTCDQSTVDAIRCFIHDQVVARGGQASPPPGMQSVTGVGGSPSGAILSPNDGNWQALAATVPHDLRKIHVLNGSKTPYIEHPSSHANSNIAALTQMTFEASFGARVGALIQQFYADYGIAISVNRQGDRRNFQQQYDIYTQLHTTGAGPEESNHNFGRAVDLGFKDLRWMKPDGTLVSRETSTMHQLDPRQMGLGEAHFFWDALRAEGLAAGLFNGPVTDRPHLQSYNDATIDMARRLAVLLTSRGQMKWAGQYMHGGRKYQCDLGFGGPMFDVGSSIQIWSKNATITLAQLTQARSHGTNPNQRTQATQADLLAMKSALKAEFEWADANWTQWTP